MPPIEGKGGAGVYARGRAPTGGQGIEARAFDELVAAMRAGVTYANVHSTKWPGGEIRGQLDRRRHFDD